MSSTNITKPVRITWFQISRCEAFLAGYSDRATFRPWRSDQEILKLRGPAPKVCPMRSYERGRHLAALDPELDLKNAPQALAEAKARGAIL